MDELKDELTAAQHALRCCRVWERTGIAEHWPLTTAEVVNVLRSMEYDINAVGLAELDRRGLIPGLVRGDGTAWGWDAADVFRVAGVLAARRQWMPTPSIRDHQKHPARVELEIARACGDVGRLMGSTRPDLRALLVALTIETDGDTRERLLSLVHAELEMEYGIVL